MHIIVPLAGPDFVTRDGVKGKIQVEGTPLLRRALESRAWWRNGQGDSPRLTFVLLDSPVTRAFAHDDLARWYPAATTVFINQSTRGAALSALAGAALAFDPDAALCIDLADIIFDSEFDAADLRSADVGAAALTFISDDPSYSYLRTDADGRFLEAAEKRVISKRASAGVYFFRSLSVYLKALAHSLDHSESQTYRGLFYVCPVLNGVRAQGLSVILRNVDKVIDIKAMA